VKTIAIVAISVGVSVALFSIILITNSAFALSCAESTWDEEFDEVDLVFIGSVTEKEYLPSKEVESYEKNAISTLQVEEIFKGSLNDTVKIKSDEALWGIYLIEDWRFLIFGFDMEDYVFVDPCGNSGSLPPIPDLEEIEAIKSAEYRMEQLNAFLLEKKLSPVDQKIPSWIKNTAGWWAEELIEDSDFIQSMEFLIKEEIIQVPVTSVSEEKSDTVPQWVKNNAGWWAEGMISDNDFVNGIQFMIKNGIITIQDFSKKMEMNSPEIAKEMSDETEEMIMDEAAKEFSSVSEKMEMEDKGPKITHMGEFRGLAGHHGEGNAKIFSVDEESFLRFERFTVTNGPDLFVYIAQDGDVHNGILLQRLKGSTGDQNYLLPEDIDIEVYNTAVVYCKLFGVYFAEAKLSIIQGY